jgi:hypothetical protein
VARRGAAQRELERRRVGDLQLDVDAQLGPSATRDVHRAELLEQVQHGVVGGEQLGREHADAVLGGATAEASQQQAADPSALRCVDHRHRRLGGVRAVAVADVARDPEPLARPRIQRADRLVVDVVDVGEERQLARAQAALDAHEAAVARLVAEALPAAREQRLVLRAHRAHEHLAAAGQPLEVADAVVAHAAVVRRGRRLGLLLGVVAGHGGVHAREAHEVAPGGRRLDREAHRPP